MWVIASKRPRIFLQMVFFLPVVTTRAYTWKPPNNRDAFPPAADGLDHEKTELSP